MDFGRKTAWDVGMILGHCRADRRDPRQPGDAQARMHQQAAGCAQGVAARDDLTSSRRSSRQPAVAMALRALGSKAGFDSVSPGCGPNLNATNVAMAAAANAAVANRSHAGALAISTRGAPGISGSDAAGQGRSLAGREGPDRIVPVAS